jgi:hypothetical protein
MPIIFHLFKKYPKDEFIVIGDYKFDVLDRYLATFAMDVHYMLLKASTKGNAAGIKEAVSFIPDGEPFMIMWSDIILSDAFRINKIKDGCQVGIADFPCSWTCSTTGWKMLRNKVQESPPVYLQQQVLVQRRPHRRFLHKMVADEKYAADPDFPDGQSEEIHTKRRRARLCNSISPTRPSQGQQRTA